MQKIISLVFIHVYLTFMQEFLSVRFQSSDRFTNEKQKYQEGRPRFIFVSLSLRFLAQASDS